MAKVLRSDIEKINNYTSSALDNEQSETEKIISAIKAFSEGSNSKLSGEIWDKERNRLATFIPVLELRKELCNTIKSAITEANNIMLQYMNGISNYQSIISKYGIANLTTDEITNDILGDIQNALDSAQANYDEYVAIASDTTLDANVRESARQNANDADGKIQDLKKLIEYLDKLTPTDNNAASKYEDAISQIAKLKSLYGNVEALYAPPAPKINVVYNTVYVQDTATQQPQTTTATTPSEPVEQTNETTTTATPNSGPESTVTITEPISGPTQTTTTENTQETPTSEIIEEENPDIEEQITPPTQSEIPTPSSTTTTTTTTTTPIRNRGNNTIKNIGKIAVGLAAAGAAGYAGYNVVKKAKDKDNDNDDNYAHTDDEDESTMDLRLKNDDN